MAEKLSLFATTAKGMETLLLEELQTIGGAGITGIQQVRAGVAFQGTLETAYRTCLWSRIANRILLPLAKFPAPSPEKLYGGVKAIRWSDHLLPAQTLAVDFSSSDSKITHTRFGALKVKDAIVDQLRSIHGSRPSVDPARPDVRVNVYLHRDEATVSIDLSGDSLHRRGYREEGAYAPLKENLAAAILRLAGWPKPDSTFALIDPMCGSGTLPIEAALMATNVAPGLRRPYFGFLGWQGHVPVLWKRLLEEAQALEVQDRKRIPRIVGYDEDPFAVRAALANIERAGLRGKLHVEKRELGQCASISEKGVFVVNPPYGERLGEVEKLKDLYRAIGDTMKRNFKGWEGYIFTGSPELAKSIGLKASRRFVLYNGAMECRLLKFELF